MHCYQSTKNLKDNIGNYSDIAFVPTMGNLHEGHLRLVERAKSLSNNVVVSIFINPIQFNSKKDFDAYPKTLTNDKDLLKSVHADSIIFLPNEKDILSYIPFKQYALPELAYDLCGKYRPGHFNGVIHIINILFNLIQPKFAIFGKKDYQQLKLIEKFSDEHYLSRDKDKNKLAHLSEQSEQIISYEFTLFCRLILLRGATMMPQLNM